MAAHAGHPVSQRLVLMLAFACGAAVANLYYAQPLLATISRGLGVSGGEAGLLVTITQIGYAIGLVVLVPLGDILPRRRLVPSVLVVTFLSLVGSALSPSIGWLFAACAVVGVSSVVVQMLVPLAADLAGERERGRVVGTVMSGLLVGILLARTVSGLIAAAAGWRAIYWLAAALMLALATVLSRTLPDDRREAPLPYRRLLATIAELIREEPLVRRRAVFGALGFAGFSVYWTSIAFLLAGPAYRYGEAVIGLFGLLGAAGATMASVAGRLADAGHAKRARWIVLCIYLLSFGVLALGLHDLACLILGTLLMDLAVQGSQILNQSEIYAVRPSWRSRITTVYMTSSFIGGAVGSAASAAIYGAAGWRGVCALGAGFALLALLLWTDEQLRRSDRRSS